MSKSSTSRRELPPSAGLFGVPPRDPSIPRIGDERGEAVAGPPLNEGNVDFDDASSNDAKSCIWRLDEGTGGRECRECDEEVERIGEEGSVEFADITDCR